MTVLEVSSHSVYLLVLWPLVFVFRQLVRNRAVALILALLVSGLAFAPVGESSLIAFLKGLIGDLSITASVLLLLSITDQIRGKAFQRIPQDLPLLLACVLIASLFLYPMALGLSSFDPYSLGFAPTGILTILVAFGLVSAWRGYWICGTIAAAVLAGFWLKVLASQNIWDYLIDPLLALYTLLFMARLLMQRIPVGPLETEGSSG